MTWTKKKSIYGVFDNDEYGINAFELYIDDKCTWYPLEYESMEDLLTGQWSPSSSHLKRSSCLPGQMSIDNCKSWTSYPLDTLAGWRGPSIDLKRMVTHSNDLLTCNIQSTKKI